MFLNGRIIVILTCRTRRAERWGINTGGLFGRWHLVPNGSLRFRGIVIWRQEESNIRLVVIRTDTTKEGDAVLRAQVLGQNRQQTHVPTSALERQTLGKPQFFFSHSCSQSFSASGLLAGSFWKHCLRKSSRRGETVSGIGGSVSSTMRNMTVHNILASTS